jgi:CelD/BcsL family acetyltransferase involved in cellulose biosynthesis
VDCAGNYVGMTAQFSANFRSNLNKARNKLSRETGVEFSRVSRGPQLMRCFEEFLDLEASGWKGREGRGTAIRLDPALVRFYRSLIEGFGADDMAVINCLRIRGDLVAGQFCLRDEDTLYVLKLAYDETRSRLAPGNMLLEWVIREGMERSAYRYVNLVGEPPWFKDWRPVSVPLKSLSVFNATAAGWTARSLLELKQQLKPLRRKYLSLQQGFRDAWSPREV